MKMRILFGAIAACFALALTASPASAQATRTWVSGVGDDANPCSRTAPCKTFAGAISKTAPGGEINCLDPGGFGGVTITKPLSIVCQYTEGGVLSAGAGVNGIVINAGVNDNVYLRGIDLHGAGNAQNGIRFIAGKSLTIEDCTVRAYNASNGQGISFQPSGTSTLVVRNTTVSNNGSAATGGGVLIQPTGVGVASATIEYSAITNNAGAGLLVNGASTVMVTDSNVSYNTNFGIRTASGNPTVRVGNTTITGNGTGVSLAAGLIQSYGNNRLIANGGDGAFFSTIPEQ
ncbi:MAG TPA: right-handed parallel beta-helix repeat-containing protein [Allosphingosinicella sp.]|nr:right-handed parallel beta-helix repeat-containing protein [Allosphingosinicella sp.]